jgi:hypothetical protein
VLDMPEAAHKGKRDPLVQLHSFQTHMFGKTEFPNAIEEILLHSAPAQFNVIGLVRDAFRALSLPATMRSEPSIPLKQPRFLHMR